MSHTTTDLKSSDLFSLLANRRSYYSLNSSSPIPDSQIESILAQTFRTVPSSFNTQSSRFILLLGPAHHKLWDITASLLKAHMGEERWASAPTAGKLQGFRAGHGTVLFYEDQDDVEEKKAQFKNYASYFDGWTEHTSGMHQLAVWVALEAEGLGANLQHYNGVIDDDVAKEFDVPKSWRLRSQLVFGGVEGGRPPAKDKKPTDVVLKVFGKE